jgi:hypothetical protein
MAAPPRRVRGLRPHRPLPGQQGRAGVHQGRRQRVQRVRRRLHADAGQDGLPRPAVLRMACSKSVVCAVAARPRQHPLLRGEPAAVPARAANSLYSPHILPYNPHTNLHITREGGSQTEGKRRGHGCEHRGCREAARPRTSQELLRAAPLAAPRPDDSHPHPVASAREIWWTLPAVGPPPG